jgi:hypothetical protein
MTIRKPEFLRPSVGDELIIRETKTRYRPETRTRVRVAAVACFRVVLEGADGEKLPWNQEEFDIRTRTPWEHRASNRAISRVSSVRLHTEETLAWTLRKEAADRYLNAQHLSLWDLRGSLRKAINADPVGFVNVLRRFEGLEEI